MTRSAVNAQTVSTQLTNLHAHFTCATQSFSIRAHSPALFLLGFFASYLLIRITYTFALVRLGRTECTDVGSDLANLLLVDPANNNFRVGRSFCGDPLGQLVFNRMGETQCQVDFLALCLRTVTNTDQVEPALEP